MRLAKDIDIVIMLIILKSLALNTPQNKSPRHLVPRTFYQPTMFYTSLTLRKPKGLMRIHYFHKKSSMSNILSLLILFLIAPFSIIAQQSQVRYSSINASADGKKAFSFIHITDIHIGESDEDGDFGTIGFDDDTIQGQQSPSITALRNAVQWINGHRQQLDIHFVLVSGDITDSAEKSEFLKAKALLDKLDIPYIPLIGNHDVWAYTKNEEDDRPIGDSLINEIFEEEFNELSRFFDNWDDGQRLSRTWNKEGNTAQYLQNFSFQYKGYTFLMADFNPRYHVWRQPPEPGIGPEAQIMNFEDGTWPWFKETIENVAGSNYEHVIISSHHPPINDIFGPLFAFDFNELIQLKSFLFASRTDVSHWLAAHIHRFNEINLSSVGSDYRICHVWETNANKEWEWGMFRLVDVYELPVISSSTRTKNLSVALYPNPAQDFLKISWNRTKGDRIELTVYNDIGKAVQASIITGHRNQFQLDLQDFSPGHYFIKIETPEEVDFGSFFCH